MKAGIVPVKDLKSAKARLSNRFDDAARLEIARALWADALELCTRSEFLEWTIVSAAPEVLDSARNAGLRVIQDPGAGLNAALEVAIADVMSRGAESATILPADVPLAQPEDLQDIIDTGEASDLVVVPSLRDGGTNALHLRPPTIVEPRFGPGSLAAHVALAGERGLRCSILDLERLSLDVDTPEDVVELVERAQECHTFQAIARVTTR
jgi:2-phospho-L-lactate/phosphoenolpyruvate guanylyltransferase